MASELELSPDELRELGYRAGDLLVEHFAGLGERPAVVLADRTGLEVALAGPVPKRGRPPLEVPEFLGREVFATMIHLDHPRFFAFVPSPNNFVGASAI